MSVRKTGTPLNLGCPFCYGAGCGASESVKLER